MSLNDAWPRVPVNEACKLVVDCINNTAPTVDGPTPYKMIRTPNVENGRIDLSDVRYVEEDVYEEWIRRGEPQPGDIILTREAPLGDVGLLRTDENVFLGQRLMMYRADPEKLDNRFLLYILQSRELQGQMKAKASGATVEHLRVPDAETLEIPLPPLPVQRRIAGILGAYDDLIANNRRRIELLEEMATTIFREWFVHYRFPGHADVETRETEIGEVPEHWDIVTVPEAIEVNPRIPIPDGEKHYVPMSNVSEDSMVVTHAEMRDQRRGRKFQNGDTLFARITPSLENGKTGFVQFLPSDDDVGVGSGELIGLRSKTLCPEYVYLLARTDRFRQNAIKSMSGSAGRQRVKLDCFDNFPIVQPDPDTLDRFENTARPMFESVQNLVERNQTLRETRDLLLPRLVSGKVAVETEMEMARKAAD